MTQPRLSTVYDLSNLRLHPNGLRVYQKDTNRRPDLAKITVQGPRQTWIARDVGGTAKIPTNRKRVKDREDQEGEEQPEEEEDGSDEEEFSEIDEQASNAQEDEDREDRPKLGKKRKSKRPNPYVLKRQRFAADFDYLKSTYDASSSRASPSTEVDAEFEASGSSQKLTKLELPDPSPELLKFIHRYAAEFYTERGQLLNSSRKYRKKRRRHTRRNRLLRERRVRVQKARVNHGSSSEWSDSELDSEDFDSSSDDESDEDEGEQTDENVGDNEDLGDEENDLQASTNSDKGKGKGKGTEKDKSRKGIQYRQDEKLYTDMYKMFDGTAILALGMLVQEHIAQMLNPDIPKGWQEEMHKAYGSLSMEDLQDGAEGLAGGDQEADNEDGDGTEEEREQNDDDEEEASEGDESEEEESEEEEGDETASDEHMVEAQNSSSTTRVPQTTSDMSMEGKTRNTSLNSDDSRHIMSNDPALPSATTGSDYANAK
ncbi:hypothetical protein JR316_0004242 [Psilocybe cubensis]|uniref:Uncharacterized protein n=2 Tax=Psilocybe cubensis TaxID=181762 RepID=A0ACB8H3B2_PSICU|nr:hypothetical protein JR316_0004242 [Psilocybe cubensis]KAH9482147.1 hypothetical protein JR316_0004242 [Psilocybe cubensis]